MPSPIQVDGDAKEWLRQTRAPAVIEAAVAAAVAARPQDLIAFFAQHFTEQAQDRGSQPRIVPPPVTVSGPPDSPDLRSVQGPEKSPRPPSTIPTDAALCASPIPMLHSNVGSAIGRSPLLTPVGDAALAAGFTSPDDLQEQLRKAQAEVYRLEQLIQLQGSNNGSADLSYLQRANSEVDAEISPKRQVKVYDPATRERRRSSADTDPAMFVSPRAEMTRHGRGQRASTHTDKRGSTVTLLGRQDTEGLKRNERIISARACVVCGRDDRPGEERKSGFKCYGCVGIPSNPHFVKQLESGHLKKGRTTDGDFVVNDYTFLRRLGRGAFGKVDMYCHNKSNQAYAVKLLPKSSLKRRTLPLQDGKLGADPVQRAKEEVAIMAKLKHANIIQIYGTMENEQSLMIVMEYLENGQCFPSTYPADPLPLGRLQRYCCGIARGLLYLHDKGVIHRDIKPDNILLDARDNIKLADFGVSATVRTHSDEEDAYQITGFNGTPHFMPPEAFDTDTHEGEPTDVWAFGVTAYAMSFGHLPPWGKVQKLAALGEAIRTRPVSYGHACPLVDHLLQKMLERDPDKRINVDGVLAHPLFATIRIVKGQPVENLELSITWNSKERTVHAGSVAKLDEMGAVDGEKDVAGLQMFETFFEESRSKRFQVTQGNEYSITLYDTARDPRRMRLQRESLKLERAVHEPPVDAGALSPQGGLTSGPGSQGLLSATHSPQPETPSTWRVAGVREENWSDSDVEDDPL